jgi:hypothetical protein
MMHAVGSNMGGNNSHQSASAPMVAGLAARHLQVRPFLTPTEVWNHIRLHAVRNILYRAWTETQNLWFRRTRTPNVFANVGPLG